MAGQIFAYITYKKGKADDTALELAKAAGKIFPAAFTSSTAVSSALPSLYVIYAKICPAII